MSNLLNSLQVTQHPERHFSLVTADIYLLSYSHWCHRAKVPPSFQGVQTFRLFPHKAAS